LPRDKTGQKNNAYSWLEYFCETAVFEEDGLVVYRVPSPPAVNIPERVESIQKRIDAARDGDCLEVSPGVYKENIDFKGKAIILRSLKGPKVTVITGGKTGSAVIFDSGEGPGSVLEGFTVCNGSGTVLPGDDSEKSLKSNGGGIICVNSSPSIINNIIRNNNADNGGGICCMENSSPVIKGNIIKYNKAAKGGGIRCSLFSSPRVEKNKIFGNRALRLGGGVYWREGSYPFILNNEISYNISGEKGGGLFGFFYFENTMVSRDVVIRDCVIRHNYSPFGPSMAFEGMPSRVSIENCEITKGLKGVSDQGKFVIWTDAPR
jgi:hypothetical protein